jgi:hypothetical protein
MEGSSASLSQGSACRHMWPSGVCPANSTCHLDCQVPSRPEAISAVPTQPGKGTLLASNFRDGPPTESADHHAFCG